MQQLYHHCAHNAIVQSRYKFISFCFSGKILSLNMSICNNITKSNIHIIKSLGRHVVNKFFLYRMLALTNGTFNSYLRIIAVCVCYTPYLQIRLYNGTVSWTYCYVYANLMLAHRHVFMFNNLAAGIYVPFY